MKHQHHRHRPRCLFRPGDGAVNAVRPIRRVFRAQQQLLDDELVVAGLRFCGNGRLRLLRCYPSITRIHPVAPSATTNGALRRDATFSTSNGCFRTSLISQRSPAWSAASGANSNAAVNAKGTHLVGFIGQTPVDAQFDVRLAKPITRRLIIVALNSLSKTGSFA